MKLYDMMTKIFATQFFDERIATLFPEQFDIITEDPENMARQCNRMNESQIIILAKPGTIGKIARTLANKVQEKTILLLSIENGVENDDNMWLLNLGAALAYSQTLSPGIFIVHDQQYYYWNEIVMENEKTYLKQAVA